MAERIRILKFLSVFMIGGTERQFVNVVKNLDSSRFDVHLACFRKFGAFLPEIEACRRPLTAFAVNSLYSYKTLLAQLRFMRYLREHRIQVLHTYGLYPNLFAIPAARMMRNLKRSPWSSAGSKATWKGWLHSDSTHLPRLRNANERRSSCAAAFHNG